MATVSSTPAIARRNARYAIAAGFLGWTFDAFDYFVLVFVLPAVAKDFGRSIPDLTITLMATLAARPIGAVLFGLLADRFGRRPVLMANVVFYSLMEVLSGLAPSYSAFLALRLLYGIGMGGTWGVGASLVLESVPPKWRGVASGLLQEGYAVGNLLAAGAFYTVFPHWGWRAMFFIGVIPALVTLLISAKVQESEAWHQSRTDWATYRAAILGNWRLFLYLVALLTMFNFFSHGTQDLYPTYLQLQRHYNVSTTAMISAISMVGAIVGGLIIGNLSNHYGRRRAMVTAALLALCVIPLWMFAPSMPLVILGAFLMQFMVQGAWGVIPAHINELSPPLARGFFAGFAYQMGVLIASRISNIEAVLGEHFSYAASMGGLAAGVFLIGAIVIWAGPEAKGVSFVKNSES
ncbi:MAG TPA: MFS transporter [Bryobacteraceae bacterium]|jgi:SHS family lactate transporter-like MFS transporter